VLSGYKERRKAMTLILYKYAQPTSPALFGSTRAAQFLRDAAAFTDSVDIVTIGDSNSGSSGLCGYQFGLAAACAVNGMPVYATPLVMCAGNAGANNRSGGMFLPLNQFVWSGVTGNLTTLRTAAAASNANALAIETALGYNTSNLIIPYSFTWDGAFVASGNTYTSPANGTRVRVLRPSTMTEGTGAGGTSCQYRLVHGTFNSGSGQFKLLAMRGTNTIVAQSASFISTNTGTDGYATASLDFTSPTVSSAPVEFSCAYDGYNNTAASYQITGPFCALWHSVIEKRKGFSVSNLLYQSGATVTNIADKIVDMGDLLTSYLKELRERQIQGTGSGRVIVWCNSGVNGPANGATWTAQMERVRDQVVAKWVTSLGYPAADLAFIFSVTHPQFAGATETTLQATRDAANQWALSAGANVCVVDISKLFSSTDLSNRRLYQSVSNAQFDAHLWESIAPGGGIASATDRYATGYGYDIHIANNGYAVVGNAIVRSLLASV
jgi:hypothetical protein